MKILPNFVLVFSFCLSFGSYAMQQQSTFITLAKVTADVGNLQKELREIQLDLQRIQAAYAQRRINDIKIRLIVGEKNK